jgi:hypothetical protein
MAALLQFAVHAADALVLGDFEDGKSAPFEPANCSISDQHATRGKSSLKLEAGKFTLAKVSSGLPADWSKYDLVTMDVFNPTDKHVKLYIQIRDNHPMDNYWAWHNRYTALAPGKNEVQFAVADTWRGEIIRRDLGGMLDPKNIVQFVLNANAECFVDNLRFETFPVAKVEVPGLKAFDVEPEGAPGFPGFTPLTPKDEYAKAKGFGWQNAKFANTNPNVAIRLHPDNLFRDWLSFYNGELAIDLPNGKYRVHLQIEDPGAWELMQNYSRRTVSAEGKKVIEETMNNAQFNDRYFRNQDSEDLPGEDPFEKYVETRHPWHVIDVEVADNQLNLGFASPDAYGMTLSALVVYPLEHAEKGAQFIESVKGMRRFNWAQSWKNVAKAPAPPPFAGKMAEDAKRDRFVLFAGSPDADLPYDHVPQDAEALAKASIVAAQGEYESAVIGMRPAAPLGKVEVKVSVLKTTQGDELPAASVSVRVGRYRFKRYQGEQSGLYTVSEKQLRFFNRSAEETLVCDDNMLRRFWLTVSVPESAKPGSYSAEISIKAEKGGERKLPLTVEVLPFKLPAPDHSFALYGCEILPQAYFDEARAERPTKLAAMYSDLREHGINYLCESEARFVFENGKAVLKNQQAAAADFALRQKMGFLPGPINAPGGCSLQQLSGNGEINGLPKATYIECWHKAITDIYKENNWPHPFFCYGDEPNLPATLKQLATANDVVHAVSKDIWMGIAYHIDPRVKESYDLANSIDIHHLQRGKQEDFELAKKNGKFLLHCNVGNGRMPYGLREWHATKVHKTDGCITYSYTGSHVDIYYGLDAREDDFNLAPPRKDGTLTTTAFWERIREGIDDYRYARAVDVLAGDASTPAAIATEAAALLQAALEIGALPDAKAALTKAVEWRAKAQGLLTRAAKK